MARVEAPKKEQLLELKNREEMSLTGVMEVISFSETAVSLKTTVGDLLIKGEKLNIGRLNTDTGELFVKGRISMLRYSKVKGGMLEGLLK